MKKILVFVALLALAAIPSFAQSAYLVDFFSNNPGPGSPADKDVRLVNSGAFGTPLTSPIGDVCANIYVFDANQEMVECCSCRITPNGLLTLSVGNNLTNNPVTSVVPVDGAVKIVATDGSAGGACTPVNYNGGPLGKFPIPIQGYWTHKHCFPPVDPRGCFISFLKTETNMPAARLSDAESGFLPQACQFARYLGSSKGVCTCS
jgi:hypothetical protein